MKKLFVIFFMTLLLAASMSAIHARHFASQQARFTSPDPLASSGKVENPQSWNRYNYCLNNPLNSTDPSGLLPTNYVDENGTYLGNDGNANGAVCFVASEKEQSTVQNSTTPVQTTTLKSAIPLPPQDVRNAIGAAEARSGLPNATDPTGGFHEEGLIWGQTYAGTTGFADALPGPYSPDPRNGAEINLYNPASPAAAGQIQTVQGDAHIHPAGEVPVPRNSGTFSVGGVVANNFQQKPCKNDWKAATAGQQHIVVGARTDTVYFYNSKAILGTMTLSGFLSAR